ncbi:hypothetical protein T492DRAFT_890611 [Pavlovales sp. CCMP2436]|nr:hypothetical protein T492DRAFT_890611 [Pavlovales sp. CCMP2436]
MSSHAKMLFAGVLLATTVALAAADEGTAWLAANAQKEGVVSLPSGLQYKVLRRGHGDAHPAPGASMFVVFALVFAFMRAARRPPLAMPARQARVHAAVAKVGVIKTDAGLGSLFADEAEAVGAQSER